jgi:hypothetical protein
VRSVRPEAGFAQRFFPNVHVVADKIHVLRLLTPDTIAS